MAITISPELEGRIQRVVESGRYATPEQAIESAVHTLEGQVVDEVLSGWKKADLQTTVDEGLWSAANEPLVTPEEARAHLAKVRDELNRG